jgi:hypothetical protein
VGRFPPGFYLCKELRSFHTGKARGLSLAKLLTGPDLYSGEIAWRKGLTTPEIESHTSNVGFVSAACCTDGRVLILARFQRILKFI